MHQPKRRLRSLRRLSSDVFKHGQSPMPTTSEPLLGPATVVLGMIGTHNKAVKLTTQSRVDEIDEALMNSAERHNGGPSQQQELGLETLFLSDVINAGHFLAQVQSFMLSSD
ncbi:hypothetical protein BV898_10217 [Hypsibius exemplaris]|uniref:Uncharacterized protein n=1 Tax=Hypsibius exemplaris TaxID=2072580 RepID=A0A1W0WK88_HYPEX|nr:hypothetical protein BV898_10217 [Hypsibius exemplaris]